MATALSPRLPTRRDFLRAATVTIIAIGGWRSAAAADGSAEGGRVQVTIDNFTFSPATISVRAGQTVTWVNHDDIPHSVVCPELHVKSHVLDSDESFSRRFDEPGSHDYFCGLHPHMKGTVVVAAE